MTHNPLLPEPHKPSSTINRRIKSVSFSDPELLKWAMDKVNLSYGGNLSRYMMALVRRDQQHDLETGTGIHTPEQHAIDMLRHHGAQPMDKVDGVPCFTLPGWRIALLHRLPSLTGGLMAKIMALHGMNGGNLLLVCLGDDEDYARFELLLTYGIPNTHVTQLSELGEWLDQHPTE